MPPAAPRSETLDGLELHLGTNYLACFLLTMRLLPFLRQAGTSLRDESSGSREARIVMVASKLHEVGSIHVEDPHLLHAYSPADAYGQSKLAQVILSHLPTRPIPGRSDKAPSVGKRTPAHQPA